MPKGPIYAIALSVLALICIYFFTDIKAKNQESVAIETEHVEENRNETLENFTKSLNEADQKTLQSLNELSNSGDMEAVDELIRFYESKEQYNFAAFVHTKKAKIAETSESWELAGDRQISVSENTAYDETFNTTLYNEALISYQNAIDLDPDNLDLQVKLGSAIVARSPQPMQGISLLLGVVEKDSMHVNANLALGKFGIISAQYDKAVIRLEKVLSSQPENTEALFLIAEAYSNLGNIEKAVNYLEKCKELVQNEELKKEIDAYLQQLLEK